MFTKAISIIKDSFLPNHLKQVIFFITSHCNSKCQHCFYWRQLNESEDSTLDVIERISSSLPVFSDLLLSGGEPFLREDLVEIVKIFKKNNKIKTVNIPTNGLLGEKIKKDVLELAKIPKLSIFVNFSLDGPLEIHDSIRGIKGGFERVINILKEIYILRKQKSNIFITITTVVNSQNVKHLNDLMDFIEKLKIPEVFHYFEIIRGEPKERKIAEKISLEDYKKTYKKILEYQTKRLREYYGKGLLASFKTKIAIAHLNLFYQIQANSYFNFGKWPIECVAGRNIFVIDANGDLKICELKKKTINLKEIDHNLSNWKGVFKKEIEVKKREKCFCTHSCFLYLSLHYSPMFLFLQIFRNLFKKQWNKF